MGVFACSIYFFFSISLKSLHFHSQVHNYSWGSDCSFCKLIGINSSSGTCYKKIFSMVDSKAIKVHGLSLLLATGDFFLRCPLAGYCRNILVFSF